MGRVMGLFASAKDSFIRTLVVCRVFGIYRFINQSDLVIISNYVHDSMGVKFNTAISGKQLNRTGIIAHPIPRLINTPNFSDWIYPLE